MLGYKNSTKAEKSYQGRTNFLLLVIQSLAQRGISKDHNVKVRPQPRCKTEDIEDHFKPILRKNPDAITIHSGTNDAKNDKTTKKKKKKR